MIVNVFVATPKQKVLDFIARDYTYEYYDSEVYRELKTLGRASVNNALRELESEGLIQRVKKGKIVLNRVNMEHPAVREFKKLRNICVLFPIIEAIKSLCDKVVLFGSQAQGTNLKESDMDLFVVTEKKEKVRRIIQKTKTKEKIQTMIYNASEYLKLSREQAGLYQEIMKGIVLWEK